MLLSTSRLALPVAELREKKKREEKKTRSEEEEEGAEEEEEEKGGCAAAGATATATTATTTSLVARFFGEGQSPHPVVARLSRDVAAAVEGASESLLLEG